MDAHHSDYLTPAQFRQVLNIRTNSGGSAQLGDVLSDWQRADFEALDSSWERVALGGSNGGFEGAWLERPRGHSKTGDLATMAAWILTYSQRKVSGVAAAADKDQARLLRNGIETLVRLNDWLDGYLDVQAYRVVNKITGSELEILSADVASSFGLTPDFVILDEVTHHTNRDLTDSLLSSAAKTDGSLVVAILNAGNKDTWQWELREQIRQDPEWYFHQLDGPKESVISAARLAKQQKRLPPSKFKRLWLNQWGDGAGDAIDAEDIQAAIKPIEPLTAPEPGFAYVAGVDLGLTRDSSAIVVLGIDVGCYETVKPAEGDSKPESSGTVAALIDLGMIEAPEAPITEVYREGTGRIRLAAVEVFTPTEGGRVSLEAVEKRTQELHDTFLLQSVGLDPWQAAQMTERLLSRGVPAEPFTFNSANLQAAATETMEAFRDRRLDLFDHVDLIPDIKALRIQDKGQGFRLVSSRKKSGEEGTAHGDTATALSIALALLKARNQATVRISVGDPLVF